MKTKMNIEWKTGRPQIGGNYLVVDSWGYVSELPFTVEYGWNTTNERNKEFVIADEEIVAWTEAFGNHVIDILRHRGIIKGKEG